MEINENDGTCSCIPMRHTPETWGEYGFYSIDINHTVHIPQFDGRFKQVMPETVYVKLIWPRSQATCSIFRAARRDAALSFVVFLLWGFPGFQKMQGETVAAINSQLL